MKITLVGGTGSIGKILIEHYYNKHTIQVISRNEYRQWLVKQKFPLCKYNICDIRDKDSLLNAFEDQDCIIHLAAMKHVSMCYENPLESVKTNILGTQNVIDACKYHNIPFALLMSTDKAEDPANTYGATKLIAEQLWLKETNYPVLRAGNLVGSTGSVLEIYKHLIAEGKQELPCTSISSIRYWMSSKDLTNLFDNVLGELKGIYVPALRKFKIVDLIKALDCKPVITSLTQGEKNEEVLYTGNTKIIGDKSIIDQCMSVEDIQKALKEL